VAINMLRQTHPVGAQIPFPTKSAAEVNRGKTIPRTVHQVEINPLGKDIPLWRMLAGMAILAQIKPDKLLFHYPAGGTGPNGEYWERLVAAAPTVVEAVGDCRTVTEIFGRPVTQHMAHKSDVIRLEIMMNQGGIYLDSDMFVLKPFDAMLEGA
jgi:hypothetical protein